MQQSANIIFRFLEKGLRSNENPLASLLAGQSNNGQSRSLKLLMRTSLHQAG
ncbi:hypothetical protein [Herbaspirillum sp. SJZ099]|uniref:hypothetical protein n=1 Tax=Herbaspirillum sp. SJZ099 TaxID=2572916 RepID=UPI0016496E87|nr:hypothetical protein [Herbaspirillum sp. SJZ099]